MPVKKVQQHEKNEGATETSDKNTNVWVTEIDLGKWRVKELLEFNAKHEFHDELRLLLDENVVWQDKAKEGIVNSIIWRILSFRMRKWPLWTLFFSWPTWVWKTQMVKALAKVLLWNEDAFTLIPCENYQEYHTARNLFGAPQSYVWYDDSTPLNYDWVTSHYFAAKKLWTIHPMISDLDNFSIILFDEIEKAHPDVHQSLLTLLSEGEVRFSDWSMAVFENCLIVFTSNIWESEIGQISSKSSIWFWDEDMDTNSKSEIRIKRMREMFSPEFLWRVSKIIEFNELNEIELNEIINIHMKVLNCDLANEYIDSDISINLCESAIEQVLKEWYSQKTWARDLIRYIDEEIENKLNVLFNSDKFDSLLELENPVIIHIEFNDWKFDFYVEYSKDDKVSKENKSRWIDKKVSSKLLPTGTTHLNFLNSIFILISAYIELYHFHIHEKMDFDDGIKEYENKLKRYWFTESDLTAMKNTAYIDDLNSLGFVTPLEWFNIPWWKSKNLFHPYRKTDIYRIVDHCVRENYGTLWDENFWNNVLHKIIPKIKRLMKIDDKELTQEQIGVLLANIRESISENDLNG